MKFRRKWWSFPLGRSKGNYIPNIPELFAYGSDINITELCVYSFALHSYKNGICDQTWRVSSKFQGSIKRATKRSPSFRWTRTHRLKSFLLPCYLISHVMVAISFSSLHKSRLSYIREPICQTLMATSSFPLPPQFVCVAGLANFRDIGGWPIFSQAGIVIGYVREGVFYRGPDTAQIEPAGEVKLRELGITKYFDIRSNGQIRKAGGFKEIDGIERVGCPAFPDGEYSPEKAAARYVQYASDGTEVSFGNILPYNSSISFLCRMINERKNVDLHHYKIRVIPMCRTFSSISIST